MWRIESRIERMVGRTSFFQQLNLRFYLRSWHKPSPRMSCLASNCLINYAGRLTQSLADIGRAKGEEEKSLEVLGSYALILNG